MALPLLVLLVFFALVGGSDATWCICRPGLSTSVYQEALDYACGNGADCDPIQTDGNCFIPNDVQSHCSYAANSYFQSRGQDTTACDFSGTATVTQTDPSPGGGSSSCTYPSTSSNTAPTSPVTPVTPTTPTTFPPPGFVLTPPSFGPSGIPTGFDGSGSKSKNLVSMTATPIFIFIASSWIFFNVYLHR